MAGPLIVSAAFGPGDFAALDALRRAHFPPERNRLPAHLTLFHALPPSVEAELSALLAGLARSGPPRAALTGVMDLGGGVALRVTSEELGAMRDQIADRFHGCLTAQDSQGWRPHVTIQNKVSRAEAIRLRDAMTADFRTRPVAIAGLELHRYAGGPWEFIGRWSFRGPSG